MAGRRRRRRTAAYGTYAAATWYRYGKPSRPSEAEQDPLLDRFMPVYEVVECHHVRIAAPAAVTFAAAKAMDLSATPLVRAIFRARELILRADPDQQTRSKGILDLTQSLGWVVLAHVPDREVVVGAVTKPWEPNPTFRGVPPDEFVAFAEPGYIKIAWTLRADLDGETRSIFRTETRAVATDPTARARFRRYCACLSPGIILIRRLTSPALKADAEHRARSRDVS